MIGQRWRESLDIGVIAASISDYGTNLGLRGSETDCIDTSWQEVVSFPTVFTFELLL